MVFSITRRKFRECASMCTYVAVGGQVNFVKVAVFLTTDDV